MPLFSRSPRLCMLCRAFGSRHVSILGVGATWPFDRRINGAAVANGTLHAARCDAGLTKLALDLEPEIRVEFGWGERAEAVAESSAEALAGSAATAAAGAAATFHAADEHAAGQVSEARST
eukprot:2917481-Pleurochrysis_carterae.AAC.3